MFIISMFMSFLMLFIQIAIAGGFFYLMYKIINGSKNINKKSEVNKNEKAEHRLEKQVLERNSLAEERRIQKEAEKKLEPQMDPFSQRLNDFTERLSNVEIEHDKDGIRLVKSEDRKEDSVKSTRESIRKSSEAKDESVSKVRLTPRERRKTREAVQAAKSAMEERKAANREAGVVPESPEPSFDIRTAFIAKEIIDLPRCKRKRRLNHW